MRTKTLTSISLVLFSCILLSGCGKKSTVYFDAAMNYLDNGLYQEASFDFIRSLSDETPTKECYRGYGIALFYLGNYDAAQEAFINALHTTNGRIHEIDYDINSYLAKAYERDDEFDEAIKVYDALITQRPKESDYYFNRALCYLKTGNLEAANSDFSVVTESKPNDYDKQIDIFFAFKDAGFEADGKAYLLNILEKSSKKISDYDRGRMYYYLEDYENARKYLEEAKDMSKTDTILMLGKVYEANGDYNYAASLYNSYLNSRDKNAEVYNQLGICRSKNGEYDNALIAYQLGIEIATGDILQKLLYNEAVTYEYLLDFNTAYDKMAAYLKKYPDDSDAKHELSFLETRRDK